ncbi:GntR family transcriptional regulator [Dactylosporangium maewongense]|uniref:GntR family transcriptional regulator n=1 Tax=Dactylosporangium maewongense TaxID=634393 RepID=A0ABN2BJD8_9ACTN
MARRTGGNEAAYGTLARELRDAILRDEFKDGRPLPTEAELASTYSVSRQTVRRAFLELVNEGLVTRVPGRGTFVSDPDEKYLRQVGSIEDLMALSIDTEMEIVHPLGHQADIDAAGRLQLTSDFVYSMTFLRRHHETPFCVTTVYVPPTIGKRLLQSTELPAAGRTSTLTVVGLIDTLFDDPVVEADQSITAVAADADLAKVLNCGVGEPLLRVDRVYSTANGTPVELAISYFLPRHYTYRVRLRRTAR